MEDTWKLVLPQIFAENTEDGAEGMKTQRKPAGGAEATEEQWKTSACKNNCVVHLLISIILHFWLHFKVSFVYDSSKVRDEVLGPLGKPSLCPPT